MCISCVDNSYDCFAIFATVLALAMMQKMVLQSVLGITRIFKPLLRSKGLPVESSKQNSIRPIYEVLSYMTV